MADQLIGMLAGAGGAANQTGSYYQNAMNNVVNSTGTGSPAATTFGREEMAALRPQFAAQNEGLAAKESAMGITHSGAAKADFGDLAGQQSATLAANVAPLYSSALNQYGQINAAEAPAQNSAYQTAIQQFYAALEQGAAAAAGVPTAPATPGGVPGGTPGPYIADSPADVPNPQTAGTFYG